MTVTWIYFDLPITTLYTIRLALRLHASSDAPIGGVSTLLRLVHNPKTPLIALTAPFKPITLNKTVSGSIATPLTAQEPFGERQTRTSAESPPITPYLRREKEACCAWPEEKQKPTLASTFSAISLSALPLRAASPRRPGKRKLVIPLGLGRAPPGHTGATDAQELL
ncbi:uncharacterized protein BDZ99DRAFT_475228 [Mytilinidion resinicola]|uniref:Uncharacterized protein n=1 Tax=Mytilinidion resinicola TaxID=574789 RepID=A0A6A6YRY3_9PEZI|nr:uncharacterized protein BDZ99DRAFT_475228 [Mytilinidion resinicola]KAF2811706.1 hypothetical protein BDZ99DRAFT_475228 [Mytilinidion resinicola]